MELDAGRVDAACHEGVARAASGSEELPALHRAIPGRPLREILAVMPSDPAIPCDPVQTRGELPGVAVSAVGTERDDSHPVTGGEACAAGGVDRAPACAELAGAPPEWLAPLFARLDTLGISHRTREHPPVFTVEAARSLRDAMPGVHVKNLFLKDKKGARFLVTTREETRIDLKRLHERLGASGRLSFGSAEQLQATLGVAPGSVTPLAALQAVPGTVTVVLDAALKVTPSLHCHPLDNRYTTRLAVEDLVRALRAAGHEPLWVDLPPAPDMP